jgi:hypothetical protein
MPDGRQRQGPAQIGPLQEFRMMHRKSGILKMVSGVLVRCPDLSVTSSGRPLSGTLHTLSWTVHWKFRMHLLVMNQQESLLQFATLQTLSSGLAEALNSTVFEIAPTESAEQFDRYSLVSAPMLEICRLLRHFGGQS